jgi:hypothetical protein
VLVLLPGLPDAGGFVTAKSLHSVKR